MAIEMVKCTAGKIKSVGPDGKESLVPVDPPIEVSVSFDFGADLDEAVEKHTKEQVFALYKAKGVIAVQDAGRRLLTSGKSPEEVIELMKSFKFGMTLRTPVDPKTAAMSALSGMTPEERTQFLKDLTKIAKEKGLA